MVDYKVLSKLVKDFTNISTSMLSVEKFHTNVIGGMKKDLKQTLTDISNDTIIGPLNNQTEIFLNACIATM